MANEKLCDVHGLGDVCMIFENGFQLTLKNVRHVPDLAHNLMSCSALEEEGLEGKWEKGHISMKGLELLHKNGILRDKPAEITFCDECVLGKQHKVHFPTVPTPKPTSSSCILDYVHADVWGPANIETHE
ncbi:UNVERIFIED_CONTAM: hypothetical protein Sradi_0455900, partial [Sesamum radiatum]